MLDNMPWGFLIIFAVWMAVAPWPMGPEPHLVEKIRMLSQGNLKRPLDIFDLLLHAAPIALVAAKAWLHFSR